MNTNLLTTSFILAGIIGLSSCSNDDGLNVDNLPLEVASDFEDRHSNSSGVQWEKEGNYYEAEFTEDGVEKEIIYDLDGNWIQTETEISLDDVPQAAIDYINANYPGAELDEADSIMRPDGDFVEVEIKDGGTERELLFDADGNFIEETIEDESDEDDDDD